MFVPEVPPLVNPKTFEIIRENLPGWPHYVIGLDLGQKRDHTAVSILDQRTFVTTHRDKVNYATLAFSRLRLRHIEKIPLHTSYVDAVSHIVQICEHLGNFPFFSHNERYRTPITLIADSTGVGAPVLDMFRREFTRHKVRHPQLIAATITSGGKPGLANGAYTIPKRELIHAFQIALQNRDFEIAAGLPDQRHLIQELSSFERKLSASGHETFQASGAGHDDLVMSLLLAVYWASRYPPPTMRDPSIIRMVPRAEIPLEPIDLKRLGLPSAA